MSSTAYYIITATNENGKLYYETPFFEEARKAHSDLMMKQLDPNDFTCDVKVHTVLRDS